MGYTIYGKHLEFTRDVIQPGDTVKVVAPHQIKSKEVRNWLNEENRKISIGDRFTVHNVEKNSMGLWVTLNELNYTHPIEKFLRVDKK